MSTRKHYKLLGASLAAVATVAIGAVGISANAQTGGEAEEKEIAITGEALDKASAVSLQHTGGGQVRETELGDEESYYEIEVAKDGKEIDVQLDENFKVVGDKIEQDSERE